VRFLLSRRWLLFALTVAALAWLASQLGDWQFHRLDERRAENRLVAHNLAEPPVPIDELMKVGAAPSGRHEWREVVAHGTWDDAHTIVVKYQTRDAGPGVDVVTPLRTDQGAVLVDRGWMASENNGGTRPRLPAAQAGDVTVLGWVRVDGTGSSTQVHDLATRAISSRAAARVLPYPLYGGFLDLHSESPAPATRLGATEMPDDKSEGPHFFYGLQWWFFGVLAVVGFGYLAYDEWRRAREERETRDGSGDGPDDDAEPDEEPDEDPSEGAQHAAVDGQHHAAHE
jgi:cytochrome oxidase assembly protein ShyY1